MFIYIIELLGAFFIFYGFFQFKKIPIALATRQDVLLR